MALSQMRIVSVVLTWSCAVSLLSAQKLSFGLIGGASVTDAVDAHTTMDTILVDGTYINNLGTRWWSQSKDWLIGAVFEFRFNSHFSAEANGIYRELHATWAGVLPDGTLNSISPSPVVTWEFPLLAKYRFGVGRLEPFIETGPSFRTTGNLNFEPSHYGFTSGAGLETRWRGFDIAPVVRYTRWAHERYGTGITQLNQLELLVAFKRAAESNWSPLGTHVSIGTVLGWGLTNDLSTGTTHFPVPILSGNGTYTQSDATQYYTGLKSMIAGASVEVHLPSRFSVEIDALHKPLRNKVKSVYSNGTSYPARTYTEASTWQFPVLAKYRLWAGGLRPFLEAGPSFHLPNQFLATSGATAGAGIETQWRTLRIAPAVRFTHWAAGPVDNIQNVHRNEAVLAIGFSLGGPSIP
jgi:hypothetical protein